MKTRTPSVLTVIHQTHLSSIIYVQHARQGSGTRDPIYLAKTSFKIQATVPQPTVQCHSCWFDFLHAARHMECTQQYILQPCTNSCLKIYRYWRWRSTRAVPCQRRKFTYLWYNGVWLFHILHPRKQSLVSRRCWYSVPSATHLIRPHFM